MNQALFINDQLTIPAAELTFSACRASGPGGQNVNKVASKVELRFALEDSAVLSPAVRERLRALAREHGVRQDAEGRLLLVSQPTRDQGRNLEAARQRLRELLLQALVPPRPRVATRPSRGARLRRLADKHHQAERKRSRSDQGW